MLVPIWNPAAAEDPLGLVQRLALDAGDLLQLLARVVVERDHLVVDDDRAGRGVGAVDDVLGDRRVLLGDRLVLQPELSRSAMAASSGMPT